MGRVEACRICLITDVKMQRIQGSLETNFKSVFGHNVQLFSDMPDYCCYECSALITKFSKFRKKYFTSQGLLFTILQNHGVVTELEIKNIDRVASNLNSNLSTIVINSDKQLLEMKIECEPIEHELVEDEIDNSGSEDDVPLHSSKLFEHVNVNSMNKKQHTSKRKNPMNTENESGDTSNKMRKLLRNRSTMKDFDVAKLTNEANANGPVYLQADDSDDELPDMDNTIEDNNPTSSEISLKLLENQNVMIANQNTIMSTLSDFSARFQSNSKTDMLTRNCSTYKTDSRTIIENRKQLDEFENNLNDPEKRQILRDKYSILFNGKGDGITCGYILIDTLFCRKFMTQCSWSGGSRGGESKIPFKVYNNTIKFFHELIHECDSNFSMMDCHSFVKVVLKNSVQRSTSKLERMSTGRKRRRREKKKSCDIVNTKELLGLEAT